LHGQTRAVRTTDELKAAFNNLQMGNQIYIYQPNTPYRKTQWPDIDVDGITVETES
jgi:hypothetical protein